MAMRIRLASGSDSQKRLRRRLSTTLKKYGGLRRWQFTDVVLVDDITFSYSHPVLTIGTKAPSTRTDVGLLSVYLHEQMHWFLSGHPRRLARAMKDLRATYPKVKIGRKGGGARDEKSTYLHLLVCFLELEALSDVIGERKAWRLISSKTYYKWIYAKTMLDYGKIRKIAVKRKLAQ